MKRSLRIFIYAASRVNFMELSVVLPCPEGPLLPRKPGDHSGAWSEHVGFGELAKLGRG